jgi:hypothetical protein
MHEVKEFSLLIMAGLMLGIFVDPENSGNVFLCNRSSLLTDFYIVIFQKIESFKTIAMRTSNCINCSIIIRIFKCNNLIFS